MTDFGAPKNWTDALVEVESVGGEELGIEATSIHGEDGAAGGVPRDSGKVLWRSLRPRGVCQ
jgi:hypothetical protein